MWTLQVVVAALSTVASHCGCRDERSEHCQRRWAWVHLTGAKWILLLLLLQARIGWRSRTWAAAKRPNQKKG